jgi:drug/metabolite transporter (DMT)-like permease
MRKTWSAAAASVLTLVPFVWLCYFVTVYRCDLTRYARLWRGGVKPEWLTGWELGVTGATAAIALIVAPKVVRQWRTGRPLTRGEWTALGIVAVLLGIAAFAAPAAMIDPSAKWRAFLGQPTDQCVH